MTPAEYLILSLAMAAFIISLVCVAVVVGMARATHTVQYVPHQQDPMEEMSEHLREEDRIREENEKALLSKVGPIPKKEKVTAVEDLDLPLDEISTSDVRY